MKTYLFALSGEDLGRMAADEAASVIRTETDGKFEIVSEGAGWLVASFDESALEGIASRVALTKEIGELLCTFSPGDLSPVESAELPPGTFAVRAFRFEGAMKDVDSQKLTRAVGGILSKSNDVDLKNPDVTVRLMMSDTCQLYLLKHSTEAGPLMARKVSERPFFSPISLHPKYARAIINLTGVRRGGTVLDPFCGTGGIVIEAASMGMRALASDFDPEMVDGTLENMDYFGLDIAGYEVADVSDIPSLFSEVDAVVCDPPYGRATKTGGETIRAIYDKAAEAIPRVLAPGAKAGIVLPYEYESPHLVKSACYVQYVHGTLNRYYHVFAPAPARTDIL